MRYSAVLLAGGKSSRMGCNKAFLQIAGKPLWQRQLATLRRLSPEQLMISGPAREEWKDNEIVADEIANAGPLAGISAALRRCTTPRLVVLAVDLPKITATFYRDLLIEAAARFRSSTATSSLSSPFTESRATHRRNSFILRRIFHAKIRARMHRAKTR